MKRTLIIAILCVLLLSTVGAVATVAKDNQPAGKSSIWQYSKQIDPAGHGKLVVNTKTQMFAFVGEGCTHGTTYYLYYTDAAGQRVDLRSAAADMYGKLTIAGSYKGLDVTLAQLAATKVTTLPKFQAFCHATYTMAPNYPTMMMVSAQGSWTGQAGVVNHMLMEVTDSLGKVVTSREIWTNTPSQITSPQVTPTNVLPIASVSFPLTGSITVWDSSGNMATATSQAVPG